MVDQTTLPSLMHSFVGQSSIKELCPPARIVLQYGNSFPASTRTKIKWTCRKPDVRATPRNKLIYCQNSAEVILVQVLLLLRSSTHTHTHTQTAKFVSFSLEDENHSIFPCLFQIYHLLPWSPSRQHITIGPHVFWICGYTPFRGDD